MEVNSFWHGGELTPLEILCMSSYLRNGIGYNLFVYERPAGLPAGVTLRNAEEILPRSRVFAYETDGFNRGSFSGFSNLFRYSLIHQRGGWWVDTDHCCLTPFGIGGDYTFVQEPDKEGMFKIASCFFKAPAGSEVLENCLQAFDRKDVSKIIHGETGPLLITGAIQATTRESSVIESPPFLPVPWWEYKRLFFDEELSLAGCCTVHFWNAMIDAEKLDKHGKFPAGSVFERLKAKYL
jgi:hypothetical protein